MVKVGFIVEGGTEKILVGSPQFIAWLNGHGLQLVRPVIDARGGGNLLPKHLGPAVAQLRHNDAAQIIILTDSEADPDIERVKRRLANEYTDLIFIAVKAIEAWFLADSAAMNRWLKTTDFYETAPEATPALPWDRLKAIATERDKPGPGSKVKFAKQMVKHYGFLATVAAEHPNCLSASEFKNGLLALTDRPKPGGSFS